MLAFRTISRLFRLAVLLMPGWAAAQSDPWRDTLVAAQQLDLARQYHNEHRFAAEIAAATEATGIYTRLYGHEHPKTALARLYIARGLREINREQEALDLYYQSLPVFETARDTFRQAICHHQIGLCLRKQYRFSEIHRYLERVLELLRTDSLRYASRIADIQLGIGATLNAEKRYAAAIPPVETARSIYVAHGDSTGLGYCGYHLGNAWFGLHDYARAKEQYLLALSHLKNLLQPGDSYFADLYVKIGLCCQKTGESEVGLRYLLEAREMYLRAGVEDLDYIRFLQDLGQFYLSEHQPEQATEQLEICLSAKENYHGHNDFHLLTTLQVLGDACQQARRYDQAETHYRRMLQIAAESLQGNYAFTFRFYTKLAELRYEQGDLNGCLQHADSAFAAAGFTLQNPREVLPRDYFRELCLLYSKALYQLEPSVGATSSRPDTILARSEQYAALAAETLYREMAEITVNSSREIFYDRDHPVLEHWLDTRMALLAATGDARHAEAAFQVAGKGKAFLLAEAMRQNSALHFAGVPDSLLQEERSLRERIVSAEKKLQTSGFRVEMHTDSNLLWLNSTLTDWRHAYDVLLQRIEREHPDYFRLRKIGRDISSVELRRHALAPDQALLLYSQTAIHLYAFVLTSDSLHALTLPTDATLADDLEQYQQALTAYYTTANADDALYDRSLDAYVATAQRLFQKLVAPVAALLPERIVVIPDGKLWYLPFEALLTGTPSDADNFRTYPFWAREKILSYCLSPDMLLETTAPAKNKAEKRWLGIAPFADSGTTRKTATRATPGHDFSALPYSGQEVRDIAALVRGEVWVGDAAGPDRFRSEAHRYGILHLATHSRADDRQGDYSFVATSPDGVLFLAKELFAWSLAADMVVLSACEAGGGRLLRGEGIIGLVRGFAYAGASSIVASHWVAHDRGTASLMADFYRNLLRAMPKDAALRAAQTNFMHQHPTQAHPFFWAGFRVYGLTAQPHPRPAGRL